MCKLILLSVNININVHISHLKSRLRTEKLQMSTPEPEMALNVPPTKPVKSRTRDCQRPKRWMLSKVLKMDETLTFIKESKGGTMS